MKKQKNLIVPTLVPRNPLVAAAKLRRGAGSHHTSRKTERQQAARQLRDALHNPADGGVYICQSIGALPC
ncbi:MAG: hypothetical protein ACRCV6_04660 [Formosimonas sp.]